MGRKETGLKMTRIPKGHKQKKEEAPPISKKKPLSEAKLKARSKRQLEAQDIAEKGIDSSYYYIWIRSVLRGSFRRWPSYNAIWKDTPSEMRLATARGGSQRQLRHWQCAICGRWFVKRKLNVDHITPAGSLKERTYEALGKWVARLMCDKSNLRVICDYLLKEADSYGGPSCHWRATYGDLKEPNLKDGEAK